MQKVNFQSPSQFEEKDTPVGAHGTGVPGREPPHDLLLVTRRLGAAVNEGGDIARHVEEHHVVAWGEKRKVKTSKVCPRMEFK